MRKFEITVLAEDERTHLMVMQDRCTLSARDTADAAEKYAKLFAHGDSRGEE